MVKVTGRCYAKLGKLALAVLAFAAFTAAPGFINDANAAVKLGSKAVKLGSKAVKLGSK
jgi:hypothetical protein